MFQVHFPLNNVIFKLLLSGKQIWHKKKTKIMNNFQKKNAFFKKQKK